MSFVSDLLAASTYKCSFLDEDKNTDLIRWSTVGDSFVVLDEEEFARTLIPELFKHKNYASFVRQLNMYGFHKQVGLSDNSMRASERKNKSPSEYKNPYFRKGKPDWMWLIQKPKAVGSKSKGGRVRSEDANEEEEGVDSEVPATTTNLYDDRNIGRNGRPPLLISQGSEAGPEPNANAGALAKEELAEVHREIKVVRQQNLAIANIIAKMKQDQDAQAKAFQEQHLRHENSINAILTFLATVYNRSLENHQGQDIGSMFAGAMPQNFQQYGSVVDVGDLGDQDLRKMPNMAASMKRQPLLLKAAPESNTTGNSAPSQGRGVNLSQATNSRRPPSSSHSNQANSRSPNTGFIYPEDGDVLSWINAANSNDTTTPTSQMDFGEALSHLQNRNGKGPLSASEREGMLEMMSNGGGSNLPTPRPPEPPNAVATPKAHTPILDSEKMAKFSDDMETVNRTLQNSQQSLDNIISRLSPMSPGRPDFSGNEYVPPPEASLDFDSMFNTDDYFASNADFATDFGDNNFSFDDALGPGEGQLDGGHDAVGGRVESIQGSEATTPAQTIEEDELEDLKSPRKRRRKS